MALNFRPIWVEPQANRLTFHLTNGASECKINEITAKVFMYLKSRRNFIQTGALVACLPSLAFSQNNSPDMGSTIPWSQVKLLNDEVLKSTQGSSFGDLLLGKLVPVLRPTITCD